MQDIVVSFSLRDALLTILLVAAIAAVIALFVFLIRLVKATGQLGETLDKTNKILGDVSVISENAKNGTEEAKVVISKVASTVSGVSEIVDTNKSTIKAVTNLANAGASLTSLINNAQKKN